MTHPLVSAIVLCYNQAQFVTECLESIKAQQYPNLEIIVNDDASRDDSVEVAEAWLASNSIPFQLIRNRSNQGICRSMNNALSRARGRYISGIAGDDAWLPGKLLGQVSLMERLPQKVGVVYSDALQMEEHGRLLPLTFFQADGRSRPFKTMPEGNVHLALWQSNFVAPMTTLIRRECFQRVGQFDENLFAEDWDMWLRISRHYDFACSPEVSAKYRIVNTSATRLRFGRLLDDMCRTCIKHLKSGQLERDAWRAAAAKLQALASSSFNQKSTQHKQNLLQAVRYRPSLGNAGRLLFAWCGLGSERCQRVRSLLKHGAHD
jgi:glycosyltransferase involved in cell wall biosynthesis